MEQKKIDIKAAVEADFVGTAKLSVEGGSKTDTSTSNALSQSGVETKTIVFGGKPPSVPKIESFEAFAKWADSVDVR